MNRGKLSLLVLFCTAMQFNSLLAQSYTIDYSGSYDYEDVAPNQLFLYDDQVDGPYPIGFSFDFFETGYTEFYISSNGFITFDDTFEDGCCDGQFVPDTDDPNNLIALAWEDLNLYEDGYFAYETVGSPGSRRLIVTFSVSNGCYDYLDGQIWLYEGSNRIELHTDYYYTCGYATQGIENATGTEAYTDPFRNADFWTVYSDYIAFVPSGPLPEDDAGVSYAPSIYCAGTQDITARIQNFGSNDIDSVTVNWEWDGVLQTPVFFDAYTLVPEPGVPNDVFITLGSKALTFGSTYPLKVWTSMPNGMSDPNPVNDTLMNTVNVGMEGTYTIGGTTPDYVTFAAAIADLELYGVCDSVIMNVRDGDYNEQIDIAFINGAFGANKVIFQSESGDSSAVVLHYNSTTSGSNYTIRFDNTYNIQFKNMTIEADGPFYGRAIAYISLCSGIEFHSCTISSPPTTGTSINKTVIWQEGVAAHSNLVFDSCRILNGTYGVYHVNGFGQPIPSNLSITNCLLSNQSWRSILLDEYNDVEISNNQIISDQVNVRGIELIDNGDPVVTGNEIYLSTGQYGIFAEENGSGNDVAPHPLVANNMVSIGGTATARGIYLDNANSYRIYHNSVWLYGSNASGKAIEIGGGGQANNQIINNIFVHTGAGYAIERDQFTNGSYSDRNVFYTARDTLGGIEGTYYADLEDWQYATNWDTTSQYFLPGYANTTDLHVANPQLNKAGLPLPEVTTDIDSEPRDPLTPDIGADEFATLPNDIAVIGFASPTISCQTNPDVVAIVKNYGSNQVTGFDVNWSLDGVAQTPFSSAAMIDTSGGVLDDTIHVNIGTGAFPLDQITDLKAWTLNPNSVADAYPVNDTTLLPYQPALNGTYTIGGVSPDYQTMVEAIEALEQYGVCGPVTLALRDGTYSEQVSIPAIAGASDINRITITSESADSAAVLIQFNSDIPENYFIELKSTEYITISHLSFEALSSFDGRIIVLEGNTRHAVVEHCQFMGSVFDATNAQIIYADAPLDDLEIRFCSFIKGSEGVGLSGAGNDSIDRMWNVLIHDNIFLEQLSDGIELSQAAGVDVYNNYIGKHVSDHTYMGVRALTVDWGFELHDNVIDLSRTGRGMYLSNVNFYDRSVQAHMYNNFVRTSVSFWDGVTLSNGFNISICHNSFNALSTSTSADALEVTSGDTIDIRNNSLRAVGGAAINFNSLAVNEATINYNNLYTLSGFIGIANGVHNTLTDWQTNTGFGANSISVDPQYISDSDLHIQEVALDSAGTPIPFVTVDIDGETRNATYPDIGADEIGTLMDDIGVFALLPQMPFASGDRDVKVVVRNLGYNPVTSFNVGWEMNGTPGATFNYSGNLAPLTNDTVTVGNEFFGYGMPHSIMAWTDSPNGNADADMTSDTMLMENLYPSVSGVLTIGGTSPDFNSIQSAANQIEFGGILDSVTFNLRNGTYEEAIVFDCADCFSCSTPVTFQSESGDTSGVIWTTDGSATPLILDAADGLTFRNLTIQSASSSFAHAIEIGNGSDCNVFDGNRIVGQLVTSTSNSYAVIYSISGNDNNNVFVNNEVVYGSYGAYYLGESGGYEEGTKFNQNSFKDQYYLPIYLKYQVASHVNGNSITTAVPTTTSYVGIFLQLNTDSVQVLGNEILTGGTTSDGIVIDNCDGTSGMPVLVANNMVHTGGDAFSMGIYTIYSDYVNIYHNTVHLVGSNPNSSALRIQTGTSNINVYNNVISNTSGGAAIWTFNAFGLTNSDYNDLFATGSILVDYGTPTYADLAAWQVTGFDANSISEDPQFVAPDDLHVLNVSLNNTGIPLPGVTTDFDGELRDPVTPDIGADEFSPFSDDVGLIAINYPVQPFPAGLNTVFVKFINNGNDTLTSMQVDWEVDGTPQPTYIWTGLLPSAGIYDSLDIGQYTFAACQDHDIKVWVSQPNGMTDGLATNDTLHSFNLYPALQGVYTIGGADPDFETIADALVKLDSGGVAGPVTFNIRDGVYLETMDIGFFPGSSCETPVVFQSESQDSSKVTITNLGIDDHVVELDGADGLIFRHLTLEAVNPAYRRVFNYTGGSDCNAVRSCYLKGYESTSTSSVYAVVYSPNGADINNTFENNLIKFGSYGFYLRGGDNVLASTVIRNNSVLSPRARGVYLYLEDGVVVENNYIYNADYSSFDGIYMYLCDSAIQVVRNQVIGEVGRYGIEVYDCIPDPAEPGLIANNFITIGGTGSGGSLYLNYLEYHRIYHNNCLTSSTNGTFFNAAGLFYNSDSLDVRNNIFASHSTQARGFISDAVSYSHLDHNDYYSLGANIGEWNGTLIPDLATWQSSSGMDANSLSTIPQFTSNNDLHVSNVLLNGAADPLAVITQDFDREMRDTLPDIGADEFIPAASDDAGIAGWTAPLVPFASGIQNVEIIIKNYGGNSLTSADVRWIVNGLEQPVYAWSGSLSPGACDTLSVGSFDFAEYTAHNMIIWTEQPNGVPDSTAVNDTLYIEDLYPALNGTYTVGGILPDFNLFSLLEAALNTGGIMGDVYFDIRPGTYDIQLTVEDFPRISATDSVVFRSGSGDPDDVTIIRTFNGTNFTILLDGAHHIGFEALSLESTKGGVLVIEDGAHDILVDNCRFNGLTSSGSSSYACVYSGTTSESNLRFLNSVFEGGSYGVFLTASSGNKESGNVIDNCTFVNPRSGATYTRYQKGVIVTNNILDETSYYLQGLEFVQCDSTLTCAYNRVRLTAGGICIYFNECDAQPGARAQVYNNLAEIDGSTSKSWGFYTDNISNFDINFNTMRIQNAPASSIAFEIDGSYGNDVTIRNCIMANFAGNYAFWTDWSVFASSPMDHCNFYSVSQPVAHWYNDWNTLIDLQGATGQNLNSKEVDPIFADTSGYVILQAQLDSAASVIAGINDDIDGNPRDVAQPDIGAYEFTLPQADLALKSIEAPATFCGLSAVEMVTVQVQNRGSVAQNSFDVGYSFNGGGWIAENVAVTISPGETYAHTFATTVDASGIGIYTMQAYVSLGGDQDSANDSLFGQTFEHIPALTAPVANMLPENGTIDLDKTVSLSWAPAPNATKYDIYLWPSGESQPVEPQVENLTQINTQYTLAAYGEIYQWQVVAKNSCNQMQPSAIQQFTVRELPDLVVDTVIAPMTAFSGQEVEVEWQVRNLGPGSTQSTQWSDAVYLSTDATLNLSFDTYLGAVQNLTALDSGIAYTNTAMLTIPNGLTGNYYVFVMSDRYNELIEGDNNNNARRTTMTTMINLTPPPDLIVTSITLPTSTFSGQTVQMQYSVQNIGLEGTGVSQWYDRVYVNADPVNYAGGILVGTYLHTGALDPDSAYSRSVDVTFPNGGFGDRYVYVITDWYNAVFENAGEGNNVGQSDTVNVILTPPPDLLTTSMTYPDTIHNNEEVFIEYVYENQGGSTVTTSYWYDRLYYSISPIYNTNFLTIAASKTLYPPLMPMDPMLQGMVFTMSKTATGTHFFYLESDRSDRVYEYIYEDNNIFQSAPFIVVNPDLRVDSIAYPDSALAGTNIQVNWDLINNGPGHLINRHVKTAFYLSDQPVFNEMTALQVDAVTHYGIDVDAGDTVQFTRTLALPDGLSGSYFIHLHTDYLNEIFENDLDSNNVQKGDSIVISLPPYPDLINREIVTPDTVAAGTLLSLMYEAANIGLDTVREVTTDSFFLSFSPVWNPVSNTPLGRYTGVPILPPGDSQFIARQLFIPENQTSNYYYLYTKSDAANEVYELIGESNNIQRSDSIFVTAPLPIDLMIDTVYTAVDTFTSGTGMTINWSVINQGTGVADAIGWFDAAYLSVDTIFDPELDLRLAEFSMNDTILNPGDTIFNTRTGLIPNGVFGDYYLIMYADDYDSNNDVDTANNDRLALDGAAARQMHIELNTYPDLIVENVAFSPTAIAGQQISVDLYTKNNGTGNAHYWQTRMYLSSDDEINYGDILLTTEIENTVLAPDSVLLSTLNAFIPVSSTGNLILIIQLDATDSEYEYNGEDNNIQTLNIEIVQPPPSDLTVNTIAIPDSAFAGDFVTVSWSTQNIGSFPASGYYREIVYFSEDTVLDVTDQVFGVLDSTIYIPPGVSRQKSLYAPLNGLSRTDYYAIVQTDARNNIFESSDTNNIKRSDAQLNIDIEELFLDSLTADVITNGFQNYFRIEIPISLEGEEMRITLDGDSLAAYNEMFLKYGDVPTPADFDATHLFPFKPDQELLIEDLQAGTYYMMVRGYNPAATTQDVTILARIIDFELISVSPNRVGRNSQATFELIGTQLDTLRNVYLVRDSTIRFKADSIYVVDSRRAYATFSIDSLPFYGLDEMPLGFYDIEAERWDGRLAELYDAVEIIDNGLPGDLQFVMDYPETVGRINRVMKVTIYFQNSGDADLVGEEFVFEAPYGNTMAFTYEDLLAGNSATSLAIPVEGPFGPPGILRPKSGNLIEVFVNSRPHPTFALTPVNE